MRKNIIYYKSGGWFIPCCLFSDINICKSLKTNTSQCHKCVIKEEKTVGLVSDHMNIRNVKSGILLIKEIEL